MTDNPHLHHRIIVFWILMGAIVFFAMQSGAPT